MTSKDIKNYIRLDLGQAIRHDPDMILEAVEETSDAFDLDEWSLLRFILANEPMDGTHSYGFHTAYGRSISEHFSFIYGSEPQHHNT